MWNALIAAASGVIIVGVLIVFGIVMMTSLGNSVGAGTANNTAQTIAGYYGTTSGGLASYLPLVITMAVIGGLLGFFGFKLFAGAGQGR